MTHVPRPRRAGQEAARPQPDPKTPPASAEPNPPAPLDPLAAHDAEVRALWDARQAKLPPHKRRTLEQLCADEEERMGRGYRRGAKAGLL